MLMPGKGKTVQARLWAYVVDDRAAGASTPALAWYRFTPDRSGVHPQSELKDFTGLLQADSYAGFEKLYRSNRIHEFACWAHFRRKIFENHATSPTSLTNNLLDRIAALYRIEEEIRGQPPDQRRRHRQDRSRPQVNALRSIIDDALRRLSPKSNLAKALSYGRKRWDALTRYIDEGIAEIDNNIAERAIRSVAIGRKLDLCRIEGWRRTGCRHLFRHRDRQAQRHRTAGLHRRCYRENRWRLARYPLG